MIPAPLSKPLSRYARALLLAVASLAPVAASALECGNPGGDGGGPIAATPGALSYYQPTASASAGTSTLSLTSTAGLAADDMLLVIQMQGAEINSNNNAAYGDGVAGDPGSGYLTNANFVAGLYEYAIVSSAGAGTVTLQQPLANSYRRSNQGGVNNQGRERFQVIRVPQYSNVTLSGNVSGPAWDGETGGVLPIDVAGDLDFNGFTITMAGSGFRGGGGRQLGGGGGGSNNDYRNLSTNNFHAAKGEGVAGTPRYIYQSSTNSVVNTGEEGYPRGSNGMGAPGNAGGGGTDGRPSNNDENSGGGGGGNGGAGARGGNTWNSNLPRGGFGGIAFPATVSRLVMGGGGGAGSRNNSSGADSSGGAGGGIIMIRAGRLIGPGTVNVDGAPGNTPENDGGGGGGAGGSILVLADSQQGSLTLQARGGTGGNAHVGGVPHGPGGGGGGGVVLFNANISASVDTSQGASGFTVSGGNFFGATPTGGGIGDDFPNEDPDTVVGADGGSECVPPDLTVDKSAAAASLTPGDSMSYSITIANVGLGKAHNVVITDRISPFMNFEPDAFGPGQSFLLTDDPVNPSGLTIDSAEYSEDGGSTYQAIPGTAGWQDRLTHWRLNMDGIMPRDSSFTIEYQETLD